MTLLVVQYSSNSTPFLLTDCKLTCQSPSMAENGSPTFSCFLDLQTLGMGLFSSWLEAHCCESSTISNIKVIMSSNSLYLIRSDQCKHQYHEQEIPEVIPIEGIRFFKLKQLKSTKHKSNQMLVFAERGKPEYPKKNLSEQGREPTNSAHLCMTASPGIEPERYWWKASALTLRHPCSP